MSQDAELRVEHALFVRSFFAVSPPTRVVSQFAARMHDLEVKKNELIFTRGAPAHAVYFVVDGEVALEAPDAEPWIFGRGALIGIADAVLERPRARTARARSRAHLVWVEYEDYTDILEDNYEFSKTLLERTMATIHQGALALAPDDVFAKEDLRGTDPIPVRWGKDVDEMRRLLALRDVRALATAPVQPLVTLAKNAAVEHWSAGEVVFEPGRPADSLRVLAGGEVEVSHPEYRAVFEPGSILGAHAAIGFSRHPHRATALTDATTLAIAKEDVYDVMEDHFGLARRLFGWLALQNERTRELEAAVT